MAQIKRKMVPPSIPLRGGPVAFTAAYDSERYTVMFDSVAGPRKALHAACGTTTAGPFLFLESRMRCPNLMV